MEASSRFDDNHGIRLERIAEAAPSGKWVRSEQWDVLPIFRL